MSARRLSGSTVLVVDTETTGLTHQDRIIEIAVVTIDALQVPTRERPQVPEPRVTFQSLVNPEISGPWQGSYVNGIYERDVADAPTWRQVWERIQGLFRDEHHVMCAHNAPFDQRFIDAAVAVDGATPPVDRWLDTQRIAQRIDSSKGAGKLSEACARRGVRLDGHRAATDAMATARLLPLLIREAYRLPEAERPPERPTVAGWLEWQRRPRATAPTSTAQARLFDGSVYQRAPTSSTRRKWHVKGGPTGDLWLGGPLGGPLDGRRHDEGPWWVISAGKAVAYWSAEDADRAARWSGGEVVEVTHGSAV